MVLLLQAWPACTSVLELSECVARRKVSRETIVVDEETMEIIGAEGGFPRCAAADAVTLPLQADYRPHAAISAAAATAAIECPFEPPVEFPIYTLSNPCQ